MEIQSAFNAGVQGFQKATEDATQAAANIAASGANQAATSDNNETTVAQAQSTSNTPSLTESAIDLRVAEFQAKASANVIESADENLGTLLDVRV